MGALAPATTRQSRIFRYVSDHQSFAQWVPCLSTISQTVKMMDFHLFDPVLRDESHPNYHPYRTAVREFFYVSTDNRFGFYRLPHIYCFQFGEIRYYYHSPFSAFEIIERFQVELGYPLMTDDMWDHVENNVSPIPWKYVHVTRLANEGDTHAYLKRLCFGPWLQDDYLSWLERTKCQWCGKYDEANMCCFGVYVCDSCRNEYHAWHSRQRLFIATGYDAIRFIRKYLARKIDEDALLQVKEYCDSISSLKDNFQPHMSTDHQNAIVEHIEHFIAQTAIAYCEEYDIPLKGRLLRRVIRERIVNELSATQKRYSQMGHVYVEIMSGNLCYSPKADDDFDLLSEYDYAIHLRRLNRRHEHPSMHRRRYRRPESVIRYF